MTENELMRVIERAPKEELRSLALSNNQLSSLPPEIGKLTSLQSLDLSNNELSSLPPEIGKFTSLQLLELSNNQLSSLPPEIGKLASLLSLDVSNNQLSSLPPEIGMLTSLLSLDLSSNQLSSLPPEIGKLTSLQWLDLSSNQLSNLPPEIGKLTSLLSLNLSSNQLSSLPPEIGMLTSLHSLNLSGNNRLSALPESIGKLVQLEELDLSDNQLSALPESVLGLTEADGLRQLYLHGNDALGIPREILGPLSNEVNNHGNLRLSPDKQLKAKEPARIGRYLRQVTNSPTRPLNEAKLIVVGPGGHGKSSLIDFLRNHTFQKGRHATEGVAVTRWDIAGFVHDSDLRLNVWDFGGQEIQHSTHEFFLTERAVYLLVFCPRDDQAVAQGLYYWLDLIHLVAMQAPVIVALSKQDEQEAYVNDAGDLKRLHENIVDFIPISCDVNHRYAANAQYLSDVVQKTVSRELRHVSYKLPAAWMEIKAALECGSNDYLSYAAYQTLCATKGVIDQEDQKLLANFLHDLGTMLNYSNRLPLEETHILNPAWVTQGVYAVVLAPELRDTGGVLDERLLFSILNQAKFAGRFPQHAQRFILQMMLSFKLCYELPGGPGLRRYLVPNALPEQEPELNINLEHALQFEIYFPYILPTSVISRFIVATHSQRAEDRRWRLGLRSRLMGHDFVVRAHPKQRRVRIFVAGAGPSRVRALEVIRQHFIVICREKEGLGAKEFTFPPGYPKAEPYPFDSLLEAEQNGVEKIWLPNGVGHVNVREWLDGITDPVSRDKLQRAIAEESPHSGRVSILGHHQTRNTKQADKIDLSVEQEKPMRNRIFVSYSHRDKKPFNEFKTMMAPAIQKGIVDIWDDSTMATGAKWREEIEKALASAKVAVLMVSHNFLASKFIAEHELPQLLQAAEHEGVTVFWIYLSSCLYEQTEIAKYQAAHDVASPLDKMRKPDRQAILSEVCTKLIRLAESR